jgi:hypothetical protein
MALEVTLKEEVIYPTLAVNPVQPSILTPTTPVPAQPVRASTFITVTRGSLKASARLRDAGLGSEFNPVYSMTGKQELVPGQVYRQDIALRQTAYHFTAGNRLVLEITPFNDGSLTDRSGRDTLQHNSQYPSRLWMPVVRAPATGSPQSAPPPPSVRSDTTINMEVPDIRLLTPETLDALNGDEKNPIIFVPR